jgi:hypothetical protein
MECRESMVIQGDEEVSVDKPEQWGKIKEIVGAALEREPSERSTFLDGACGADKSLRAEVESLLSAYESADGLSESALTQTFADAAQVSKSLGPYRLLQELGEGGRIVKKLVLVAALSQKS